MNKTEASARIAAIRAELSQLEEIVSAPEKPEGLWRPAMGANYYCIRTNGGIDSRLNAGHPTTMDGVNCFPSREIAEKAAPLMARANKIIAATLQADPEAGLKSMNRCWVPVLNFDNVWEPRGVPNGGYGIFVHTEAQALEACRILNAEGVR